MHNDPEHSDCDRMNADSHLRAMLLGHSLTLQITAASWSSASGSACSTSPSSTGRARALHPRSADGELQGWAQFDAQRCQRRLAPLGLGDIADKLEAGERLSFDDGVRLFECPDLLALGWLANREREKRHGARTYYNFNIRLEATNVCVASCLFCSFARLKPGDPGRTRCRSKRRGTSCAQRAHQPLTEVHVVNGLHPDLPFDYYLELLRGFKRIRPGIHLKCFTAVEIAFFADLYGMTDEQVLRELMEAAASIRCPAAARRSSPSACAGRSATTSAAPIATSISTALAHRLGHALEHHDALRPHRDDRGARRSHAAARALQDETGGFQAFIPLAFHPDNNQMRKLPAPTAADTLRVHAVARLMLDNIPHVKAFWIATGVEVAQIALWFGVDDLDGTVQEEKIYHMAGARTPER